MTVASPREVPIKRAPARFSVRLVRKAAGRALRAPSHRPAAAARSVTTRCLRERLTRQLSLRPPPGCAGRGLIAAVEHHYGDGWLTENRGCFRVDSKLTGLPPMTFTV